MIKNLLYVFRMSPAVVRKSVLLELVHGILVAVPTGFLLLICWELFAPAPDQQLLWKYVLFMLAALLVQLFVSARTVVQSNKMTYMLSTQLRIRLGDHLQRLSMGYFKQHDPGDLAAVALQDVANFELIFGHTIGNITGAVFATLTISTFLFITDWRLALILIAALPFAWLLIRISNWLIVQQGQQHIKARNATSARFLEYLHGIRHIKSYGMTGDKFRALDEALKAFRVASIRTEAIPGPFVLTAAVVFELVFLLMTMAGVTYLTAGQLTVPALIAFLIMGYRLYEPLKIVLVDYVILRYMNISLSRVVDVLQAAEQGAGAGRQPTTFDIEFDDVSFRYQEQLSPVLQHVSFRAGENTMVALVGPSGSGKTTIASLIARFWDVSGGCIRIGGIDIRDMSVQTVYGLISTVFQEVYLFDDTIFNNIRIGQPAATEAAVLAAAEKAKVTEFSSQLPDGLHTMVGEGGSKLSGGQRQRISIARALLKDAPIVLLDEATASLDPENEIYIQAAIQELVKDKTVIIIAHKLATIQQADQILVLKDGAVVEQGIHPALVAAGGLYHKLWRYQQQASGWKISSEVASRQPI